MDSRRFNQVLAGTYFSYFAILGVITPFLSLFLNHLGFSSLDIGKLLSLLTVSRIIGPNLWAMVADKQGERERLIKMGSVFACLTFVPIFWVESFWGLAGVLFAFSLFWSAILPQLEVVTLSALEDKTRYGKIRAWGSGGFIFAVVAGGYLVETISPQVVPAITLALLGSLAITALVIPKRSAKREEAKASGNIWQLMFAPVFLGFFALTFLLQFSFGPYYGFFALYTRDLGYSATTTGVLVAIGVLAEIGMYLVGGKLIKRFGVKWILIVGTLLTTVRWLGTAWYAGNIAIFVLLQCLHAFSFALIQAASVYFIQHYFPKQQQSRGQAIYIGAAYGGGGALGAYLTGFVWQDGAGGSQAFLMAAFAAVMAFVISLLLRHPVLAKPSA